MRGRFSGILVIAAIILFQGVIFAQDGSGAGEPAAPKKFALVIGNSTYTGLTPLTNPVNDANDISVVLSALGFSVNTILDGSLDQMEDAITHLKEELKQDNDSYGFFFYAGHGVQSNGENYLIPVNASIQSENYLRGRAVSVQSMLDELNDAGNSLNVVVLDACRDNPFGWSRSANRGLAIVNSQPADSIIVYATSAGQRASDGDGRNGLFTTHLLNNLLTPGLEVSELFRLTGQDVSSASNRQQVPAIYNQFFGVAYLGDVPEGAVLTVRPTPLPRPTIASGREFSRKEEARLWSIGASAGTSFTEPWVVATIRGTLAPFRFQFFEVGFSAGFVSTRSKVTSYYSLMPYVNYAFFWPFNNAASIYVGAGAGYRISTYQYYNQDISVSAIPVNGALGILLFSFLDISYTLSYPVWTGINVNSPPAKVLLDNVSGRITNKFSVGYSYRFR